MEVRKAFVYHFYTYIYARHSLPADFASRIIMPHSKICINIWFIYCLLLFKSMQR